MMKVTPFAVFTSQMKDPGALIKADVSMTHPATVVQDAIVIYCEAIHYLLNNPTDADRGIKAYELAVERAKSL